MKYLLCLILLLCSVSCLEKGKVVFCGVDEENLTWTCTRIYRANGTPNEIIAYHRRLISCYKYEDNDWRCESTSGGLTVKDPTPYMSNNYFVVIDEHKE